MYEICDRKFGRSLSGSLARYLYSDVDIAPTFALPLQILPCPLALLQPCWVDNWMDGTQVSPIHSYHEGQDRLITTERLLRRRIDGWLGRNGKG